MSTNDCFSPHDLREFEAGRCSDDRAAAIGMHLNQCAECRAVLENNSQQFDKIEELLRRTDVADDDQPDWKRIRGLVDPDKATPRGSDTDGHGETEILTPGDTPPKSNRSLHTGRVLGDYELLEQIGQGGMGVVYRARQVRLDRIVAVKTLRTGDTADSQEVARFHAEAQAAATLRHPNIVAVHNVGEVDGHHFFSMDYVPGSTLSDVIRENPLPGHEAAGYLRKIAVATQFAHEKGIIHRDIKPGNVLIDENGEPLVTDFGLAKRLEGDSELTATGQIMGTPSYMPPEQINSADVGPHSDIYSLGAVLYAMLTGSPPFRAENAAATLMQVLHDEPIALRMLNRNIDRDLETICLKCLDKDPAKRYQTARDLAEELQRFLAGKPIWARPLGRAARTWRWYKRNRAVASLILMVAVVLTVGIVASTSFAVLALNNAAVAEKRFDDLTESLQREQEAQAEASAAKTREDEAWRKETEARLKQQLQEEQAIRDRADALYHAAQLQLQGAGKNEGKVLLAAAAELMPDEDLMPLRIQWAKHIDFPKLEVPGIDQPIFKPRHNAIDCQAFSANGRYLYFRSFGADANRLDLETGEQKSFPAPMLNCRQMEASANGRYLLAKDNFGNIALLNGEACEPLASAKYPLHREFETAYCYFGFSPDEKEAVVHCRESPGREVELRSLPDFEVITTFRPKTLTSDNFASRVIHTGDGILVAYRDGYAELYDRTTFEVIRRYPVPLGENSKYSMVAYDGISRRIAIQGYGAIYFYSLDESQFYAKTPATASTAAMEFVGGGRFLVFGDGTNQGGIIDAADGQIVQRFPFGQDMAVASAGYRMAAAGWIMSLEGLSDRHRIMGERHGEPRRYGGVSLAAEFWSTSRGTLPDAAAEYLKTSGKSGRMAESLEQPTRSVYANERGDHILLEGDQKISTFRSEFAVTCALWMDPQGEKVIRVGSKERYARSGQLEIFNSKGDRIAHRTLQAELPTMISSVISPDGRNLFITDRDYAVWIYNLDDISKCWRFLESRGRQPRVLLWRRDRLIVNHETRRLDRYKTLHIEQFPIPSYREACERYGFQVQGVETVWSNFRPPN